MFYFQQNTFQNGPYENTHDIFSQHTYIIKNENFLFLQHTNNISDTFHVLGNNKNETIKYLKINHVGFHFSFADSHVRTKAIHWIRHLTNDELCDYLPQLIQVGT